MKKIALVLMVVLTVAFAFSCASPPPPAAPAPAPSDLPDFVINPPMATDAIYGVGYGKQSTPALSIRIAETNARADLAAQLETTIQSAVVSYMQEAGVGDETQTIQFAESITRQVTDQTLQGTRTVERAPMADGGWWIMVALDQNSLKAAFEQQAQAFERSEEAAFAEFKADQALQRLDHQLRNEPTQSSPVRD